MAKKFVPAIYHNTMGQAIEEARKYAESKGFQVATEEEDMINWEAMKYETYQTQLFTLYKDGVQVKKCLNISLYRMPSGRYELTTYIN